MLIGISHDLVATIGAVGLGFSESSWPDAHLSWGQNSVRVKRILDSNQKHDDLRNNEENPTLIVSTNLR